MDLDHAIYWIMNDGWSVGVLLLFLMVSCSVVYFTARGHRRELAEARSGYDVECFVRELTVIGCDAYVARLVYRYIEDMHRIDFPILPSDDICVTLGLTEDALMRALPALLSVSGRVPSVGRLMRQLITVQDLVQFLSSAPMAKEQAWQLQTA